MSRFHMSGFILRVGVIFGFVGVSIRGIPNPDSR